MLYIYALRYHREKTGLRRNVQWFFRFFFLNLLNINYVQEAHIWLRSTTCKLHGTGLVLPGSAIVWFQIDNKAQRLKQDFRHTWNLGFFLAKCSVQLRETMSFNMSDSLSGHFYCGRPCCTRPYAAPACVFLEALIIGCTLGWNCMKFRHISISRALRSE